MQIPHEFSIGGVYLPPLLVSAILGLFAAIMTAWLLDRYRLSRFFANPPLVLSGLSVIYTILIGTLFIGI